MAEGDVVLNIIVPAAVATQVVARLQQRYPEVVAEATSDADAMRRVVGWWTASLLADSAAQDVRSAATAQIQAIQSQVETQAAAARQQAWEAINAVLAQQPDMAPPPADPTA